MPIAGAAAGPIVKAVAGPIVKASVEEINKLIKFIADEKLAEDDSQYYRKWLEVAKVAIQGLEGEYPGNSRSSSELQHRERKTKERPRRSNQSLH